MKKVLGIIGGMGPLATVKLFERIVILTDANSDQENLHILIDNNTKIPDRTEFILGGKDDPKLELIKSAKRLQEMGADYLIMGCNTAHYFYKDIAPEIDIPFINMIEETTKHVLNFNKDIKKVGLLATSGTVNCGIYHEHFNKHGIEIITPSEEKQIYVTEIMYNIKKGIYDNSLSGFYQAIEEIKTQGVELIILGCTELSLAYTMYRLEGNFVDALEVLATRAIKLSEGNLARF
jgi:aspartate racemase